MNLIQYCDDRTALRLKGGAVDDVGRLLIRPDCPHQKPDIRPGDILALAANPDQRYFVTGIDLTGMSLSPDLQHAEIQTARISGTVSVSRRSDSVDSFGIQAGTLEETLTTAPAALIESREIYIDPSPAGQQLVMRHQLLVQSNVQIQQGDELEYCAGGTITTWRIVGAWPVATGTWQVHAVD